MVLLWIVLSVMLLGLVVWVQRKTHQMFADEIFDGLTPGMLPATGSDASRHLLPARVYKGEIAVAFNPPRGVRPGLAGIITHGHALPRDVIATIVDLAARGFLTITIVEEPTRHSGRDWRPRPTRSSQPGPLEPAEKDLLRELFTLALKYDSPSCQGWITPSSRITATP